MRILISNFQKSALSPFPWPVMSVQSRPLRPGALKLVSVPWHMLVCSPARGFWLAVLSAWALFPETFLELVTSRPLSLSSEVTSSKMLASTPSLNRHSSAFFFYLRSSLYLSQLVITCLCSLVHYLLPVVYAPGGQGPCMF